ncbi:phage tail spike protein [Clostridium perfringens]|uniref:phage tail spike protein n=1 Tax=Clostridium perfringens TaxID=1502 RepID=UPI0024477DB4|nr:phage tail spike protein [Clostridium perfringens]MDH2461409.1 phage tail spike protein [Clostridium perfringens]
MIELRDKDKNRVAGLVDYENLCIESVLESGDKTLSFYYPKKGKYYDEIVEEAYIRTKKDEFVVKARELDEDYTKFECSLNLEELEGNIFDRFESVEQTITNALNLAIVGTGWTVKNNTLKKRRTVRCTNKSSLEIVREIKKVYRVDIVFNTLGKQIEVYEHLGEDKGTYFIDSLNLIALQVQSDSRQYATRIIAEGKDGLSFSDINNGKNYVENYQYSNKVKTIYWKDERYTIKENLLEDARAKLEELSKPFRSYSASILNLAELNPRYSSILDFKLGDVINLISKKNKIKDKQRIVKTIEWLQDHTKDSVELANATLKFEDIQQENQETTDTVNNITTDNGTVDGSAIDSIQVKQIEDFKANVIQVTNLHALNADIDYLKVNKADMQDVNIVKAKIGTLETTKANITELNSLKATLQQAIITKADITDLNSAVGKINVLESKTASIENALAGNLTADNFKANSITATSGIIAEGAIGSAQISSLSVNKLEAGEFITSKHKIVSADGTIEIVGNQIFINRNNVNRVILGEYRKSDGTTEYGLLVRAKDGQTIMLDGNGVHNAGITDGAIDNNKVADNANISGNKLDINSVIREVNTNGTETIKGTKVQIGDRTLDVELSIQKNTITEHSKELSTQKASIQALDNAIKFKVDTQTFTQSTQTINTNINRAKEEAINESRSILDTRKDNQNPEWYMSNHPRKTISEFKYANVIGIPNAKANYGVLETKIPWDNPSGGYPTQVFRGNNYPTYQRRAISNTSWGEWEQIEDTQGSQNKANSAFNNAKEYTNSEITIVNSNLSKATTEINLLKGEINLKVNQTDIDKTIKTIEDKIKSTTEKITTVESNLTQKTNSIEAGVRDLNSTTQSITTNVSNINRDLTSKINSNLNAAKSFATDIAISKANLAKEQAIANADGKITAEEQKRIQQAQANLNTAIAKATEAETKAKSYADVKKQEAINSANNNTNNAINNIKIGGRNYGLNTDVMQQEPYNIIFSKDLVFEKGKTYTISMDFDLENLVKGSQERVGCEGSILFKDGTRQYIGVWHWISQGATFKGRKSYTFTIENKDIKDNMTSIHIYTELVSSGKRNLGRFKIEEGNKATDYTIAPEDLQSYADKVAKAKADLAQANAIANADGKITEEERKRIQQAQENLNTAIARADKAKQDAINTASSDATNKANNALNSAKTYVNAEITTVNNKVHNVESNLNILSNEIKSKVSQSDIDKSIQEIKIGGRNLIVNSDILQNLFSPLSGYSGTREVIEDNYALCKKDVVFKCTHSGTGFHLPLFTKNSNRIGKTYTWSFWAKCSVNKRGTIGHESNGQTQVEFTTEWKKFSHTWLFGDCTYSSFTFYIGWNVGEVLYIRDFKIEEGTKATDWTPAPEDTNQLVVDSIKVVDTKISDVSSSITQLRDSVTTQINSINSKTHSIETTLGSKASKQEVTEVNNRVATIKASLDGITQRVSATESKTQTLETNLNGKASKQEVNNVSSKVVSLEANLSGITNRVSNTESRINSVDGKVNNATTRQEFTEFKQGYDNFKLDVSKNFGSKNLIRNSGFLYGYNYFYPMIYEFDGHLDLAVWTDSSEWVISDTCALTIRGGNFNRGCCGARQEGIKLKPNTKYTIAFSAAAHRCKWRLSLNTNGWGQLVWTEGNSTGGKDPNNWDNRSITFVTGPSASEITNCKLDLVMQNRNANDPYAWFTNLILVEGEFAPKWTPMSGESYSNTVIIDQDKVKTMFENGTYAQMGRDGFEWYNSGTGHSYHALAYVTSFGIPAGNPGRAYVRLPVEFTKRRKSLKWTVALRGYYYSTSGDFFPMHVHVSGTEEYEENGILVCPIEGYCKIQNAQNSGDIQFRPVTAMLIAVA